MVFLSFLPTSNSNLKFVLDNDYTKYLKLRDGVTANTLDIYVSGHLLKINAILTLTNTSSGNVNLLTMNEKYRPVSSIFGIASCYDSAIDEAACGIITITNAGDIVLAHSLQKKYVVFNIDIPISQ